MDTAGLIQALVAFSSRWTSANSFSKSSGVCAIQGFRWQGLGNRVFWDLGLSVEVSDCIGIRIRQGM